MHKEIFISLASILLAQQAYAQPAQSVISDPFHLAGGTAANANPVLIATGNRYLDWLYAANPTATGAYIHFINSATSPNCTATTVSINGASGIMHVFPIAPNFGGFIIQPRLNENYTKGLAYCVTASAADGDGTAAVSGIMIEGGYR